MAGRELNPTHLNLSSHLMGIASFIYDLYNNSNLPWVYGGEYSEFMNLAKTVVQAWIKVGLQVYFVFDGMWILKQYASTTPQ
jgi:hypothetical protein